MRINRSVLESYAELEKPGEPSLVAILIEQFVDMAPSRLQSVRNAIGKNNPEGLRRASHSLKNLAAGVGAEDLADVVKSLEELGRKAKISQAGQLLDQVEREGWLATLVLIEIARQLRR